MLVLGCATDSTNNIRLLFTVSYTSYRLSRYEGNKSERRGATPILLVPSGRMRASNLTQCPGGNDTPSRHPHSEYFNFH